MQNGFFTTLRNSFALTATLAVAGVAGVADAKDIVKTCLAAPGAEKTATVIFHPRLFGVDGHEGDGDVFTDDFEHRFSF